MGDVTWKDRYLTNCSHNTTANYSNDQNESFIYQYPQLIYWELDWIRWWMGTSRTRIEYQKNQKERIDHVSRAGSWAYSQTSSGWKSGCSEISKMWILTGNVIKTYMQFVRNKFRTYFGQKQMTNYWHISAGAVWLVFLSVNSSASYLLHPRPCMSCMPH